MTTGNPFDAPTYNDVTQALANACAQSGQPASLAMLEAVARVGRALAAAPGPVRQALADAICDGQRIAGVPVALACPQPTVRATLRADTEADPCGSYWLAQDRAAVLSRGRTLASC
jgi:hypothetical protein